MDYELRSNRHMRWRATGGYDSAIEHSVPFQGRGPLDLVLEGAPFFNLAEVF